MLNNRTHACGCPTPLPMKIPNQYIGRITRNFKIPLLPRGGNLRHSLPTKHIYIYIYTHIYLMWRFNPTRVRASSFLRFLDHTQRRTTVGRTPLDKWSACRRDLYLAIHNTHNRQISMPATGFKPTISAGERPQTYALDRAATGTSTKHIMLPSYLTFHLECTFLK